jgi:natural product precursor
MKKIKKLSLNKETISKLNNEDMSTLKGGLAAATNGQAVVQADAQVMCSLGTAASVISIIGSIISIIKDTMGPSDPQPPIDCCGTVIVRK